MTPKSCRVSIFKQIVHEFRTAIRSKVKNGRDPLEIYSELVELKGKKSKQVAKLGGIFLISTIAVVSLSSDESISFKVNAISIQIPEIYVAFVGAVIWSLLCFSCLQMLVVIKSEVEFFQHVLRRSRFLPVYAALAGDDNADFTSPIRVGHLFNLRPAPVSFMTGMYGVIILVTLFPVIASIIKVSTEDWQLLTSSNEVFLATPLAASTILITFLSIFYAVLFFVPFRIEKNTGTIRWGFLIHVTVESGKMHPEAARWRGAKNDK